MESQLTLRINGDLVPEEITKLLAWVPSSSHRRGQSSPRPGSPKFRSGQWTYSPTFDKSLALDQQFSVLCRRLEEREEAIKSLQDKGFSIDVFVGVFAEDSMVDLAFTPAVLATLGRLGISLTLDIYSGLEPA